MTLLHQAVAAVYVAGNATAAAAALALAYDACLRLSAESTPARLLLPRLGAALGLGAAPVAAAAVLRPCVPAAATRVAAALWLVVLGVTALVLALGLTLRHVAPPEPPQLAAARRLLDELGRASQVQG